MNIHKRILVTKILLLFLIGILTKRVILSFWMSRQMLDEHPTIISVGLKELFIPIVSVVFFSMLWRMLRLEYILLVTGLALTFGVLYEPLSLSIKALEILQAIGLILFVIAVIRIAIFLISKRSDKLLEASIEKWMAKRS